MLTFASHAPFRVASALFTVTPRRTWVEVRDGRLMARFGPWYLSTGLDNVLTAERTGPYRWWKVIGPARMSVVDRGLTFATTAEGGVCIRFREPVPGIEPTGRVRHPGLTVTVADPDRLVALLTGSTGARPPDGG